MLESAGPNRLRLGPLLDMKNLIDNLVQEVTPKFIGHLVQNKRRIARGLYLLAALVEQLPDPDLPKQVTGRTLTIADQLKPKRKPRGKRTAHK